MLAKLTPGGNVGVRIFRRHQLQHAQDIVGWFQAGKARASKELLSNSIGNNDHGYNKLTVTIHVYNEQQNKKSRL